MWTFTLKASPDRTKPNKNTPASGKGVDKPPPPEAQGLDTR